MEAITTKYKGELETAHQYIEQLENQVKQLEDKAAGEPMVDDTLEEKVKDLVSALCLFWLCETDEVQKCELKICRISRDSSPSENENLTRMNEPLEDSKMSCRTMAEMVTSRAAHLEHVIE